MSIITHLQTTTWFVKRPSLWPQYIHLLRRKLAVDFSTTEASHREATSWCKRVAVDVSTALGALTGDPKPLHLREAFAGWCAEADEAVRRCPAQMGGEGATDLLYTLCERVQARRVLETGVAYGWSSFAILCSLRNRADARLESVDMPYIRQNWDRYVGCVVPDSLRAPWNIRRLADRQGIPKALDALGSTDLVHYDSDKSFDGRMWAYPKLWGSLVPGGIFVSDDIDDNTAFGDFALNLPAEPIVLRWQSKYVGAIRKL